MSVYEHSWLSTYVLFSLVQYYTTKIVMYAVSALKGSERKQKTVCIILSHPSGLVLYHMYNSLIFILHNIFYFSFLITSSHSKSFSPTQYTMLVYKSGEDQCGSQVNNFIVVSKSHNTYQHSWYSHPPSHFTLMTEY